MQKPIVIKIIQKPVIKKPIITQVLQKPKRLFVCLIVCLGSTSLSRIFHSYGDVTITGEGLQICTYARHSWSLSSEGSSACHTYCDTGHPFIMVIYEDHWHSYLLLSSGSGAVTTHYLLLRLKSVAAKVLTPSLPLAERTL